jgi:hypothetical protein
MVRVESIENPYEDIFYIVNSENFEEVIQSEVQLSTFLGKDKVTDRNSQAYFAGGKTFVVSAYFFDGVDPL